MQWLVFRDEEVWWGECGGGGIEMLSEWGAASLWPLFGHSSSHAGLTTDRAWRRGAIYWEKRGGHSSADGYGGKVRARRILSLGEDRKAGGLWRAAQNEKELLQWVGLCTPVVLAFCSQPCSRARWSNERPGASDKLRPDGEKIPLQNYSAAESIRAAAALPSLRNNHRVKTSSALFYSLEDVFKRVSCFILVCP